MSVEDALFRLLAEAVARGLRLLVHPPELRYRLVVGVDPEVVVGRRARGFHRDRCGAVSPAVAAGGLARRERVDEARDQVAVLAGVGRRERLDERVQRVLADEHVPGDGDAALLVDPVAEPVVAVLAGEGVGVAARVDPVDLPEVGVVVLREQARQGVVDGEVGEERDAAAAQSHVDEALRADGSVVADAGRERADRRGVGGDADAERGSLVGLFADADGERHARPDGVLVDNVRPGTIRWVF